MIDRQCQSWVLEAEVSLIVTSICIPAEEQIPDPPSRAGLLFYLSGALVLQLKERAV